MKLDHIIINTKLEKDGINIQIPAEFCKFIGFNKKSTQLFIIPIGGVLQLSANKPQCTIPALTEINGNFVPQAI